MNSLLTKIALGVLALVIAFATGRYMTPAKIQEKEVIKEVVKEVVKTEKEYIVRDIKRPDGTTIHEVVVSDKTETSKEQSKEKTTEKIVSNEKPKYKVSYIPQYNFSDKKIYHGGTAEVRVAGPIFVGGYYSNINDSVVGITISLEL
jgi:Na+-translocating ferredoxin:NAD+ oxidoreductase RnfG subunit